MTLKTVLCRPYRDYQYYSKKIIKMIVMYAFNHVILKCIWCVVVQKCVLVAFLWLISKNRLNAFNADKCYIRIFNMIQ